MSTKLYFTDVTSTVKLTSHRISNLGDSITNIQEAIDEIAPVNVKVTSENSIVGMLCDILILARYITDLGLPAWVPLEYRTDKYCMSEAFGDYKLEEQDDI